MSDAHGHDPGLPLVDLIACALCSVLLLVFAALASRGGLEGAPVGFAVITINWEFPDTAAGVEAVAEMDARFLFSAREGQIHPQPSGLQARWLLGNSLPGGTWSSPVDSSPFVSLFAESPKQNDRMWSVRIMVRMQGEAIQSQTLWTFAGQMRPTRVTGRLIDQSTAGESGEPVDAKLDLPAEDPIRIRIVVDVGRLSISSVSK